MTAALTATKPVVLAAAPLIADALASLEKGLGGRDAMVAALAHAPKSKEIGYLLGLLGDPTRRRTSLADLCLMGGITAGELIDAYKAGQLNRAQALSLTAMDVELPKVVADTLRMALPREQTCPICEGLGMLTAERTRRNPDPEPEPCRACSGKGMQAIDGDIEHKKLALELGQMTAKAGGINIAVQQNTAVFGGSAGGALEKLQLATDQILYGDASEVGPPVAVPAETYAEGEVVLAEPFADVPVEEEDWRGTGA